MIAIGDRPGPLLGIFRDLTVVELVIPIDPRGGLGFLSDGRHRGQAGGEIRNYGVSHELSSLSFRVQPLPLESSAMLFRQMARRYMGSLNLGSTPLY